MALQREPQCPPLALQPPVGEEPTSKFLIDAEGYEFAPTNILG